ncbi:O-antigen ligase family protein [Patescibacteria group bacterium]|nr:O-antigen ligase family protein [Patescibacteria group bacterium]
MEKFLKYIIWAGLVGICFIPLIVKSNYFFPYIVPKTLAFKVIVEMIFLAFLGLAVLKKEYRPKLNLALILFSLYIATVFASSFLGSNFYLSFWSNNERSEGLVLLLHLFLFLLVLSGFFRKTKDWLIIFEASFLSGILVSLFALGQYLDVSWIMGSAGGARLASTLGNAGYVAGYLNFNIFFGLILFFLRKNICLRSYYVLGILLQIFIVLNTLTRGGIMALGLSLFAFTVYLAFVRFRKNILIRNSAILILLLGIIFTSCAFLFKKADWVVNSDVLRRATSISFTDTTAENRLMTWQAAYWGFKEKPFLGYGYENFYQVFDKYFNPKIYRKAGSVVWFDRGHNIIADRLVTGGLIGLILYLSLLFIPLIYVWRYFYQSKISDRFIVPLIFSLIMIAYFIQNFFIFEALVTYIPLFITIAFLSQFCPDYAKSFSQSKKPYLVLLTIGVIAFLPVLFSANIKPASANKGLIDAMIYARAQKPQEAYNKFIEVIEMGTPNNQEYQQQLGEFVAGMVGNSSGLDDDWIKQAAFRTEQEFDKQVEEKISARNYLMFARFLNKTYQFNVGRLDKALTLLGKSAELSPTRPQIYYEMGYSQIYLGKYYHSLGEEEKAKEYFARSRANMQKAINLNDQVVESYINMIMVLFVTGESGQVQPYLDKMDEYSLAYRQKEPLERMANSAIHSGDYKWTAIFYNELLKIYPDNPNYLINIALSYAYLGENDKAIEAAEKTKKFGEDHAKQADLFIQDVLAGKYKK